MRKVKRNIVSKVFRMSTGAPYHLNPLQLGVEVRGLDLKKHVPPDVIQQIKHDVAVHRMLIFKDQGTVSGDRHVEIGKWFGEPESTFYKHHKSPHPDVFRVSNDPEEGCTGVGRTGWHVDGSFQPAPFSHALYHMVSVPKIGDTVYVPLNELITGLDREKRKKWERLYMCSDRRGRVNHPLIYSHPITKKKVLCFHLGMTEAFLWDKGTPQERLTDWPETVEIINDIHSEITRDDGRLIYSHKWEVGDFIISDNLAVGHEASPASQFPRDEVGLRVLHRVTIKGVTPPVKEYDPNEE